MIDLPVIILNGVSSSGKTTLASALSERLRGVWLTVGTDLLLQALPARFLRSATAADDGEATELVAVADQLLAETLDLTGRLARADRRIIVDLVCHGGRVEQDRWNRAMSPRRAVWIGVVAPDRVLDDREAERLDRAVGLSRFQRTMPVNDVPCDLVVDTSTASPSSLARSIIRRLGLPALDHGPTDVPSASVSEICERIERTTDR